MNSYRILAVDLLLLFKVSNQCNINNGGCSHFCVLTSSSSLCVCPTGYALKQDGRTCENSKSFLAAFFSLCVHFCSISCMHFVIRAGLAQG